MVIFQWIVWSLFLLITVFIGLIWGFKRKDFKKGEWHDTKDVIGLKSFPTIVLWELIVLVGFLFIDFNKLNLFWIYPLIFMVISVRVAKRLHKEGNVRPEEKE